MQYEEMDLKKLKKIRSFYRSELTKLQKILKNKRKKKEEKCQHVWVKDVSASFGWSRYDCNLCGKYR